MMKVTIVGGSAPSTVHLASELHDTEVAIVGRSASHVDAVARAFSMLANAGVHARGYCGDHGLLEALPGSDIVILQARYGGLAAREYDERFPLAFGIPGDEGLGPGGLASAWRSWPELARALEAISQLAPSTFIVLMTAPLGILTICASTRFPQLRIAGLCELPFVTLADCCHAANVALAGVRFSYAGVNHLGWFDDVRTDEGMQLAPIALKYVRLHEHPEEVVEEQRAGAPRAQAVGEFAQRAYRCFHNGGADAIRRVLAERSAPWYRYSVAPLIEAMRSDSAREALVFLTTTNDGYLAELDDKSVIERPFIVCDGTFTPVSRLTEAPLALVDHMRRFTDFERIAARAVMDRSVAGIADALRAHPWVRDDIDIDALVQAVTASVRERPAAKSYRGVHSSSSRAADTSATRR